MFSALCVINMKKTISTTLLSRLRKGLYGPTTTTHCSVQCYLMVPSQVNTSIYRHLVAMPRAEVPVGQSVRQRSERHQAHGSFYVLMTESGVGSFSTPPLLSDSVTAKLVPLAALGGGTGSKSRSSGALKYMPAMTAPPCGRLRNLEPVENGLIKARGDTETWHTETSQPIIRGYTGNIYR